MIPKIIHYTWFSNDSMPQSIIDCMASWKKHMPEYEFIHWDMHKISTINSLWLSQAIQEKKYAFAADFIRLYAIYNYGGIYLDTDVFVYKSFNSLLKHQSFIGRESSIHIGGSTDMYLTSHCFGAQKGDYFIGKCLSYYNDRPFITSHDITLPSSLRLNMTLLPLIQSEIAEQLGYNSKPSNTAVQYLQHNLVVYPSDFFDCTKVTQNSFCRHLALGSWREKRTSNPKYTILYKIKWRIIALIQLILRRFNYKIVELE